jgi:hypothetical protein
MKMPHSKQLPQCCSPLLYISILLVCLQEMQSKWKELGERFAERSRDLLDVKQSETFSKV